MNHRTGSEEQQRFEKRVRENVKNARCERADAERQEHVSQLRDSGVGEHALDVVLDQADRGGKNGSQRADDGDRFHCGRRQNEDGVGARHHVHARGHHGGRMDQGRDRGRALHGIGQPDIQRELRGLAASADEQQQGSRRQDRISNRKVAATSHCVTSVKRTDPRYQAIVNMPSRNPASPIRLTMNALFAASLADLRWK